MKNIYISCFCAFFIGCSPSSSDTGAYQDDGISRLSDTAIAKVAQTYIYESDINRIATEQGIIRAGESLEVGDSAYKGLLEELIDQRLLAIKAQSDQLDSLPEARRRLAISRERILGNLVVEDYLAQAVTEEKARQLYAAQIALRETGDEVRAAHILVAEKSEADEVVRRLEQGESLTSLAFDLSIDRGTRLDGGDLGYFQYDVMPEAFSSIVFSMTPGETSPPFETEFGWHVVNLIDRRPVQPLSFEDKRDEILNYLTFSAIKDLIEGLRGQAEIEFLGDALAIEGDEPTPSTLADDITDLDP